MELPTPAGLEAFIGVCHSIQWVAFERRWIGSGMDWAREVSMEIWMGHVHILVIWLAYDGTIDVWGFVA